MILLGSAARYNSSMRGRETEDSRRLKTSFFVLGTLIVALAAFQFGNSFAQRAQENVVFALAPSAERAMEYGDRHFNAQDPAAYDFERAAYFFKEAEKLDPNFHYLNHQLARVAFLRGDFPPALAYINKQIALEGTSTPNSYYVRGLIEGYAGQYDAAIRDYGIFLQYAPRNWAAVNDYAWVLLKANRPKEAAEVTGKLLADAPDNPWLLNTNAIANFEIGNMAKAKGAATRAVAEAAKLTEREWLTAYPGNDPGVARAGIATLQKAAQENLHRIELAAALGAVQ